MTDDTPGTVFGEVLPDVLEGMINPTLIPTGFDELDLALSGGLAPGSVTVMFGHPGAGTSTLALNFATNAARAGIPSLVLSWETPVAETVQRVLSAIARVPLRLMRAQMMSDEHWTAIGAITDELTRLPLSVPPAPATSEALWASLTQWAADHPGRSVVVLDGPAIVARRQAGSDGAWEEHSRLSATIKRMAHELALSIVVTAPVVREALRSTTAPRVADVAYSPAYVTDADVALAVHRDDLYERESPRAGEADVMILKAKYGPADWATLAFQGHFARFMTMLPTPDQ